MKKTKLLFGATMLGALILPLTTAIACGTSAPSKTEGLEKATTPTEETGKSGTTPESQPVANPVPTTTPPASFNPLSANFKYHDETVLVDDDGIYFAPEGLNNASFWSGTKSAGSVTDTKTLVRMSQVKSPLSASNISLLGRGDYFYILYDEDANDIADISRFETSFAILDTASFEGDPIPLVNKNISLGNLANPFFANGSYRLETTTSMLVTFANGMSNAWISSSDVTPTTYDEALAKVKANLSETEYAEMQSYYRSHSKVFKPVYHPAGAFKSERIAKNAIKVTFNGFEEGYGLVASGIVLGDFKVVDGVKNRYFNFTFGDKTSWDKYENSQNQYQYFIRKNSYLA